MENIITVPLMHIM